MAHLQERDGKHGTRYRVVYRVDGRQRVDVFATHREAAEHVALVERIGGAAARAVLEARESGPAGAETVADWTAAYVDGLREITRGTRKDYRGMVANHLRDTPLGATPLVAVTEVAVEQWVDGLALSAKTKRNVHSLLSGALAAAVKARKIPSNPARGVSIRDTGPAGSMVFLSAGEFAVLLSCVEDAYRPLVVALAGTGMRWGEATALQVGDVDLDATPARLRITKAWKRTASAASTELGPPKTRAGIRTIGLPVEVAEAVRPLVEGRPQDAWLFTTPAGVVVRQAYFHRYVWQPALTRAAAAGMTKRPRIHDLRHTHASHLVAAGVPLNAVQARLGHESITTTVDRYSHLAPDYLAVTATAASAGLVQAMPAIEL